MLHTEALVELQKYTFGSGAAMFSLLPAWSNNWNVVSGSKGMFLCQILPAI